MISNWQKNYYDADCVEIHTGKICNLINKNKNYKKQFKLIKKSCKISQKNRTGGSCWTRIKFQIS